jgi:NADH-quinone oxidoreductase subunit J
VPLWLFIFLAALSIIAAAGVILQRHPVHSLMSLVLTLVVLAVLYIGLGATTVGFLQMIVYAGAIMILFLFVIWLLNLQVETGPTGHLALKFFGSIAAALFVTELYFILARPHLQVKYSRLPMGYGSLESLARTLFSDYLVAFEVTSVLLLAAVVGSIALARRPPGADDPRAARNAAP